MGIGEARLGCRQLGEARVKICRIKEFVYIMGDTEIATLGSSGLEKGLKDYYMLFTPTSVCMTMHLA